MSNGLGEPDLKWDWAEIAEAQVKYLQEEGCSKEEAVKATYEDTFFWEQEWECLIDALTELMEGETQWHAEVKNFGWLNRDGYLDFTAKNGAEFLRAVLTQADCTFHIWKQDEKILIQNWHHDSPTGTEWYTITSATEAEE